MTGPKTSPPSVPFVTPACAADATRPPAGGGEPVVIDGQGFGFWLLTAALAAVPSLSAAALVSAAVSPL